MKKMLVSGVVVAGIAIFGGGVYLWPKSSQVSSSQAAMSSSIATAQTSHKTTKKSVAKRAAAVSATQSGTSSASSSTSGTTEQQESHSGQSSSTVAGTSSTAGTSSHPSTDGSTTSSTTGRQLTAAQLDNWVWTQIDRQYQGASVTKSDFAFQQYSRHGLVYVDVYENSDSEANHLAGRFRVNAQGSLEQQSLANGSTWRIVSSTPTN
ncbi:hypothetical protein D1831_09235 [Lactiplantibacillus garii]|uniref:Extracellular protein n=1 Tax=Lactiplantibacillus garii TaxID=2306423 RepID=A0A426D614_9LACO|nr:hypothetical protein [Lactiplantibacillus garii]RRK10062.1 hypothetical protein D1831_09235 [Lactiplantibacillus garii]